MDFASRQDFASIQVFGRDGAEALVGSGAFDFLCRGRRAAALMALFSYCSSREPGASSSGELFPDLDGAAFAPGAAASFGASVAPRRRKEAELKYLGTTLGSHPLELWPRAFAQPRTRAAELRNRIGMRVRILGWLITAKPVLTAQEEAMEFLSFEDETAIIEAVLFPAAYVRFRHLLFDEGPLWITGRVEEDRGAVTLTIEDLRPAM